MINKDLMQCYKILEIDENCNHDDIKKAYKKLAKQYHPDRFSNTNKKKEAEDKFKNIKAAYDYLINLHVDNISYSESFESFFKNNSNLDDISDNAEFIKFYFNKTNNKKKTSSQKSDEEKYNEAVNKAFEFIESKIKEQKINMLYVYECIRNDKMIIKWDHADDNPNYYNDVLMKEVLYRRIIKTTPSYQGFIKNHNYYKNIDLHASIKIYKNYSKKRFEEEVFYKIKKICNECSGVGCDLCNNKG